MNLVDRNVPLSACTPASNRPIRGVVLHHTATAALPQCRRGASWHYCIDKDGTIYRDVSEQHVAHTTAATDRWRPAWVVSGPGTTSDVNWCSIGIEIVYAPQDDERPTPAQYAALRALLGDLNARHGSLPVIGHGQVDLSKWPTEPHAVEWLRLGLGEHDGTHGRWVVVPTVEPEVRAAAEDAMAAAAALSAAERVDYRRTKAIKDNFEWYLRASTRERAAFNRTAKRQGVAPVDKLIADAVAASDAAAAAGPN